MAVALESINLLERIDATHARWREGWHGFREEHERFLGGTAWHDDNLFRIGAMVPGDLLRFVEPWEDAGLQLRRRKDGKSVEWIDGCVVDFFGPTRPCAWISFTDEGAAYLADHEPGRVITRDDFPEFDWAEYFRTH